MNAQTPDLRAIVARVGGEIYNGGRAALVPGPGHSPKDRSLSLTLTADNPPRLLWCSHAEDDARAVWQHLGLSPGQGAPVREGDAQRRKRLQTEKAEADRKLAFCSTVWNATLDAKGSLVERYLKGRGIIGEIPPAIRFHPAAPMAYPTAERPNPATFPAMVAIATAANGRTAAGLHVTALLPDGSGKAALRQSRRMFGELAGAVVQLSPVPAGGELGVSEGLETALAYRQLTGTPTWAALSTAGLKRFQPPAGIARLVIAADGDKAGVEAARGLAERVAQRLPAVVMPAPEGTDWNDALKGGQQ